MNIEYIRDLDVDADLDRKLRDLLCICFTKPEDNVFRQRRYFNEPPKHRWFIRGEDGHLIAHIALHEKFVVSCDEHIRIGGIAEVCVRPEFRKQGLVRKLLIIVHNWLRSNDYPFAILFGDTNVYTSSGYISVNNILLEKKLDNQVVWKPEADTMVCQLSETKWPIDKVYLRGKIF